MFDQYANAVGADKYRILAVEFHDAGPSGFVFDSKNGGKEGKTRDEIREAIPKLEIYAHYNKNIYVFPISQDKHHIVVDDLDAAKLQQLRDDGFSPACIIESSPGNYQAILNVLSVTGNVDTDREAANRLTKELNTKYGDENLSGAKHSHRLPPFPNFKKIHRRDDGTFPDTKLSEAKGGICEKASQRLAALHKELEEIEAKERAAREMRERVSRMSFQRTDDPIGAYWAHARDIIGRQGVGDYSRLDGMIGIRMRVTGYSQSQIADAIAAGGPRLRKEHMNQAEFSQKYGSRNWQKYAAETTNNFVFGSRGREQFRDAEKFEPYFMKVEGRNYREEKELRDRSRGERQDKQREGNER